MRKVSKSHRMIAQIYCQIENFVNTGKKTLEKQKLNISSALNHMKTTAGLKYPVNDCR